MTTQIVATGFTLGLANRCGMCCASPPPSRTGGVTLHLAPAAQSDAVVTRAVQAIYSIDSMTIGMAVRAISAVKSVSLLAKMPAPQHERESRRQSAGREHRVRRGPPRDSELLKR